MNERIVSTKIPVLEGRIKESAFKTFWPDSPPCLIEFLRLAEDEGAYAGLSLRTRRALEMRYVEGLEMTQIGDVLDVSKQAVNQSLRNAPESLYRKMTKDVVIGRTNVPFSRILMAYSLYRLERDKVNANK
jgi:Sigma-70, region 4